MSDRLREDITTWVNQAYVNGSLDHHVDDKDKQGSDACVELAIEVAERFAQVEVDKARREEITGETSDGYHTFNELYEFRKLYNAALFNEWAKQKKYKVHKSLHHADEPHEPIFGGGWFIVMAELPTGQISNHYEIEDWDLFDIPETPVAQAWDGHTAKDVADRLSHLNTQESEES